MNLFLDFIHLFFPQICLGCLNTLSGNEKFMCSECFMHLPLTNSYSPDQISEVEKVFYGKVHIQKACAYFYFTKEGIVQQLLHQLKYKGEKELGVFMGKLFANELIKYDYYQTIDAIIPIPLHRKRHQKRGYNQSEEIAKGMADILKKPVLTDVVVRIKQTDTQTKKARFSRWENVNEIFEVRTPERLINQHILLVDDVITTGATIEACAAKLLEIENVQISLAGLAIAVN